MSHLKIYFHLFRIFNLMNNIFGEVEKKCIMLKKKEKEVKAGYQFY
jgi:hypothetical protein